MKKQPSNYLGRKHTDGASCSISKAINGLGRFNIDFNNLFSLVPGSNIKILFWKSVWCRNTPLELPFPNLYRLESVRKCSLMDQLSRNGFSWWWKNNSFDVRFYLELHEFYYLLGSQNFDVHSRLGFRFNFHSDGTYLVRIMRRLIDSKQFPLQLNGPLICWTKLIPLKVKCFIWRAVLDRIPVAASLSQRGIIVQHLHCQLFDSDVEASVHLSSSGRAYLL